MKTLVSALAAAVVTASMMVPADAAPRDRDRTKATPRSGYGYLGNSGGNPSGGCVVTGWTDWSLTRPIFKCPGENGNSGSLPRRQR